MKDIVEVLKSVNGEDIEGFLREMLTPNEFEMINRRLEILQMLADNVKQQDIANKLCMSLCNITRGAKIMKNQKSIALKYLQNGLSSDDIGYINPKILPDKDGYFGEFGGAILPDALKTEFKNIETAFFDLIKNKEFLAEYEDLLKNYSGRPTPIYYAKNLSKKYGCKICFKREDLNHTGAHKINHAIGECLLAKYLGKKKVIAETGAGQHGVAMATAAALTGLECDIYMGDVDVKKEAPNVAKMKILGANVISVKSGQQTLKEAVDEAFIAYSKEYETAMYAIGSVVGPHPFPTIVAFFQSIVGKEARKQMLKMFGSLPNYVVACVGGGSNAMGIFSGFIDDGNVKLIGVEPLGRGTKIGDNAATITYGTEGCGHGFKSLFLQDKNGEMEKVYSIASGLDYPGVGPQHAYFNKIGCVEYTTATDKEAVNAFYELSKTEGIIPALESSHAIAYGLKLAKQCKKDDVILINLSGRGDKDVDFILNNYKE